MPQQPSTDQSLRAENAELRARLEEAEEKLRAIRAGEVEALVVEGDAGPRLFTLQGLDAGQNRFRGEMLAQVSNAVLAVDLEERITFLNAAAERQYRVREGDVLGRKLGQIYTRHWPSPEREAAAWAALREHGEWRGEYLQRTHDGRELHVDSTLTALRDADGQTIGHVTTVRDITERKRAEEALRASEERFRAFVTASSDVIYRMNADWSEMRQLDGREFLMDTNAPRHNWLQEYIYEQDQPHVMTVIKEAIRTKSIFTLEHPVRRADGTVGWTFSRAVPLLDAQGEIREWFGAASDITEHKRGEEALRQNAALFSSLIAQAPMGTYVVDAEFRMRQVNAEAMPAFMSVQPVIGRGFQEVVEILWGPEVGGQIAGIFRHTLATGERYVSPPFTEQRHDLGIAQSYEWETQRVRLPDGQHGVVCYFHEVTERARATEALRASEQRMRLATEATQVGIWEWNVLTNQIRWDAQMFRIYGIAPTPDGFVNYTDWSGAVLPEDLAENEAILQDTLRRCGQSERTFRIRRRDDGACRHVAAVETVRMNAQGQAEWVVGTNLDMTDHTQKAEALHASEERFRVLAGQLEHLVKERTEELVQSQDRLRALATELNIAEHRERKRLADELHDYLAQMLVLCRINLGQIKQIGLLPKAEERSEKPKRC